MALQLYVDLLHTSPYALSAHVALTEKGLPFTVHTVDLANKQQQLPDYANQALTARVPALVDDDLVLTESSAITEYLEETYPAPHHTALYPPDRRQRAQARQLQAWIRSDLLPLRIERDTETVFMGKACAPLSDAAQAAAARLIHVAQHFVQGPQHLFGDWSIADVDLAIVLARLVRNGDPVPASLQQYVEFQWQRPPIQQWLAYHQPG